MSGAAYPKTSVLEADVLAADGALPVGCKIEGGAIYPALAPKLLTKDCPTGVTFAAYAEKADRFLIYADNLYYNTEGMYIQKSSFDFPATDPFVVDVQESGDHALLVGDGCVAEVYSYLNRKHTFEQSIFGGVLKNGRIFAVDRDNPYCIRWSGTNGWYDWTESIDGAGRVNICADRGKILKLAVYKQKLIAVCEYGLAYLTAYGTPENFKLGYIDGSTGKIYKKSVAFANGKTVFFTETGLFAYNGISAEKLDIPLAEEVENPLNAMASGDEYFLCAYNARLEKNVVYVFDIRTRSAYIADADATAMCYTGRIMCFCPGGAFSLEKGGTFEFSSGKIDFGTRKRKVLKSLHLGSGNAVDVEVKSGGKTRILRGVRGHCRPNISGVEFEIVLLGEGKVCGVKAYAEAVNGI